MNKNNLHLRDVSENDRDLLFKWANDEEVRYNSFNTEKIDYDEHCKWFQNALQDEHCKQFILVYNSENEQDIDVGQIRIYLNTNEKAEISYSIAPSYRTMGFGKVLINLVCSKIKDDFPHIHTLSASVKPHNIASKKALIDNGFLEKCCVYEYDVKNHVSANSDSNSDITETAVNHIKSGHSDGVRGGHCS